MTFGEVASLRRVLSDASNTGGGELKLCQDAVGFASQGYDARLTPVGEASLTEAVSGRVTAHLRGGVKDVKVRLVARRILKGL